MKTLRIVLTTAILIAFVRCDFEGDSRSPNILLIYVDDLGYSDLSCYGSAFGNDLTETPNIDRLAAEGMKFTDAYAAAPLCSPSRAALLSGKSPARLNFEFVTKYERDQYAWDSPEWKSRFEEMPLIPPPYTLALPLEEETLAEVLNQQGYNTGIVGKWHVAPHYKRYKGWSPTLGPRQQGFDWAAETFGSHPYGYVKGKDFPEYKVGEFPIDSLTENAIRFLNENSESPDPFFLYVSHYYVHTPLSNRLEWLIDKYRQKAGNDVSEARIKYAAFVETMDHYVGQLLDALDDLELRENTLVVFTSDNGGHPDHAFNRPLRGSKWHLYEGGIRIPMMVRWPGHVEPGTISTDPVIQTDLLPTFLEVAGGKNQNDELDGKSLVPLFDQDSDLEARPLFWHFPYYHPEGPSFYEASEQVGVEDEQKARTLPQSAIRKGKHKLLYFYEDERVELYNLEDDIQESNSLTMDKPDLAISLKNELLTYLKTVNARLPIRK